MTSLPVDLHDLGDTLLLVGVAYQREGVTYFFSLPGEEIDPGRFVISALDLAAWQALLQQTDVVEVAVDTQGDRGTIEKAYRRKSQRNIDAAVSWRCYKRDKYACRYCGRDDVPLTVDHLVRWENGGPSTEANLLSACKKCNRVRGDTEYADWMNHPYYAQQRRKLAPGVHEANLALVPTLAAIPRTLHPRSR